ncbi:Protein ABHD12B [Merluccius polli]|uniref:Protein ABHD12B n=1 Tax=Merluccius polli TaxID=89951 RepID=A0AA47NU92_MERPO|nr:Protein ABHD12B [Merluccius polli]
MRKRVAGKTSSSSRAHTGPTGGQENKGPSSQVWLWVKRSSFALCVVCMMGPILVQLPEIIKQRVYYHGSKLNPPTHCSNPNMQKYTVNMHLHHTCFDLFVSYNLYLFAVRAPFLFDLSQPSELALNHTINMYLTPEEGVSLGVWHTVPENKWKEAQGKDSAWYRSSLNDGSPVIIYLHGKTQTRAARHRVGVVNVLSAIGYHVLSMDYRGFGDSTGEPKEEDLTMDTCWLYRWAKEHSGGSRVIIWGHSLGSGVATNTAVRLMEQGVLVDGVILEGAFKNARPHVPRNPFVWYATLYWMAIERFFLRDALEKNIIFPNDENVKKMRGPLLFLHSEDDHITGIHNAQQVLCLNTGFLFQLYQIALSVQQDPERVRMVTFEGSLGYLHNGLYRDPRLPTIIRVATNTAVRLMEQGVLVDGVILEGAFKNARPHVPRNPFVWVRFLNSPCSGYFCNEFSYQTNFTTNSIFSNITSTLLERFFSWDTLDKNIIFPNDENCSVQQDPERVRMVTFEGSRIYTMDYIETLVCPPSSVSYL